MTKSKITTALITGATIATVLPLLAIILGGPAVLLMQLPKPWDWLVIPYLLFILGSLLAYLELDAKGDL